MNDTSKTTFDHELQIGSILVCSWGFEQTNVDFYQVTDATAQSVTLIQIKSALREGTAPMTGKSKPVPNSFISTAFRRRVKPCHRGYCVKINNYSWAYPTTPDAEHYTSWYH